MPIKIVKKVLILLSSALLFACGGKEEVEPETKSTVEVQVVYVPSQTTTQTQEVDTRPTRKRNGVGFYYRYDYNTCDCLVEKYDYSTGELRIIWVPYLQTYCERDIKTPERCK